MNRQRPRGATAGGDAALSHSPGINEATSKRQGRQRHAKACGSWGHHTRYQQQGRLPKALHRWLREGWTRSPATRSSAPGGRSGGSPDPPILGRLKMVFAARGPASRSLSSDRGGIRQADRMGSGIERCRRASRGDGLGDTARGLSGPRGGHASPSPQPRSNPRGKASPARRNTRTRECRGYRGSGSPPWGSPCTGRRSH